MALEALSDGDASRLAAGLAAATGGLEVLFLGYSYSRRRPPAPGTAAARLAQLLSAAGGGGRLRSVVLAGEAHLDPPYYGGEKSGRDPIWPAALAALPPGLTSLTAATVPEEGGLQHLARAAPALAPSLRALDLSLLPGGPGGFLHTRATLKRLAARLAAALSPLTALRSLRLKDQFGHGPPPRRIAWLPASLTSLSMQTTRYLFVRDLPALSALPSLRELRFTWWGENAKEGVEDAGEEEGGESGSSDDEDAAAGGVAHIAGNVTKLVCGIKTWQLASLAAAFPAIEDATLNIYGGFSGAFPPLPAPPVAGWRVATLRIYAENYNPAAPLPLLRQLCGAGGPLRLRRLSLEGFHHRTLGISEVADVLSAAPELQCLILFDAAFLARSAYGALAGVHHTALRRFHLARGDPATTDPFEPFPTATLLALGAALPNLESLHLGGGREEAVEAVRRLDGGGGAAAAEQYDAWEEEEVDEEALQRENVPAPIFDGRCMGGPLLRAIRRALERRGGGAGDGRPRYNLRPKLGR